MAAMLVLGALGGLLLVHRHRWARVRQEACRSQSQLLSNKDSVPKRQRRDEPRCSFEPFGPEYDGGLLVTVMPFVVTLVFLKLVIFRNTKMQPRSEDNSEAPFPTPTPTPTATATAWIEPSKEPENAAPEHLPVVNSMQSLDTEAVLPLTLGVNAGAHTGGMRIDTKVEGWLWDVDNGMDLGEVVDMDTSPRTATVADVPPLEPVQALSPLNSSPRDHLLSSSTSLSDAAASPLRELQLLQSHKSSPSQPGQAQTHTEPATVAVAVATQLARMGSLQRGPLSTLSLPKFVADPDPAEFAGFAPLPWADAKDPAILSSWGAVSKNPGVEQELVESAPLLASSSPSLSTLQQLPPHVQHDLHQVFASSSEEGAVPSLPMSQVPHPVTPLAPIATFHPVTSVWSKSRAGKALMGEESLAGEMGGVDSDCLENWIAALGPVESPKRQQQQQHGRGESGAQEEKWSTAGGLDSDGKWQLKSGRGPLGASNITSSSTVLDRRKLHRALALLAARQASGEALFVQGCGRARERGKAEDSDSEGDAGSQQSDLAELAPGTNKGASSEEDENSDSESVSEAEAGARGGVQQVGEGEGAAADAALADDSNARRLHVSPVILGLQGTNTALAQEAPLCKERCEDALDDTSVTSSPACAGPSMSMGSLRHIEQPPDAGAFRFIMPGPLSGLLRDAQLSLLDEEDTSWDWGTSDGSSPHPPPPALVRPLDRSSHMEGDGANRASRVQTEIFPSGSQLPIAPAVAARQEATTACDWSADSDAAPDNTTASNLEACVEKSLTLASAVEAEHGFKEGGVGLLGIVAENGEVSGRQRRVQSALAVLAGGEDHSRRQKRHLARGVRRLLRRSASMGAVNRGFSTGTTPRDAQVWASSRPRKRFSGYDASTIAWMRSAPGSVAGRPEPMGGWSPGSLTAEKIYEHYSPERGERSWVSGAGMGLRYGDWQDKECVEELSDEMGSCEPDMEGLGVGPSELRGPVRAVLGSCEREAVEEDESSRPTGEWADALRRASSRVRARGERWEEEGKNVGLTGVRREAARSLMEEDEEDPKLTAEMRSILIRAKLAANKVTALHAQIMQLSTSPLQSRPTSPTKTPS